MDEVPFGFGDEHLNDPAYQETLLERARGLSRSDANIYWQLGFAYEGLGWKSVAIETWKKGRILDPKHKGIAEALRMAEGK